MIFIHIDRIASMKHRLAAMLSLTVVSGLLLTGGVVSADSSTTATAASTKTTNQQTRLQNIISKGDQEIERRLTTLSTLTSKINAATYLTANDKSTLSSEVSSTTSGLTSLKTQLDSDTTVSSAASDVNSIYTEYRVYALVAPKVDLIKVADDQQTVQSRLTTLSQKLQTRITAEQKTGKNLSSMQSELSDLNSKVETAHSISSNIESSVINLQPSDYNTNHELLTGDNTQLKTAHSDDQAADTDAKNIVSALKTM